MTETYLRDVLHLPESVHAGRLQGRADRGLHRGGHGRRVREYVVTEQLRRAFRKALSVVRAVLRDRPRTPPTCTGRSAPARATS